MVGQVPAPAPRHPAFTLPGVPGSFPQEVSVAKGRAESEPKIIAESRVVNPGRFATFVTTQYPSLLHIFRSSPNGSLTTLQTASISIVARVAAV